jgi:hypothetical protein
LATKRGALKYDPSAFLSPVNKTLDSVIADKGNLIGERILLLEKWSCFLPPAQGVSVKCNLLVLPDVCIT